MTLLNDLRPSLSRERLAGLVRAAAGSAEWPGLVRYSTAERWYQRLEQTESYELWLLSWLPGQQTGFHDHCGSAGAFAVARGELTERMVRPGRGPGARPGRLAVASFAAGPVRSFGPRHVHDVRNEAAVPAVSVHAYSPPLAGMRRYELTAAGLVPAGAQRAEGNW